MDQRIFKMAARGVAPLLGMLALAGPASMPAQAASTQGDVVWTHKAGQASKDPLGSQLACGSTSCSPADMELRQGNLELSGGILKVFITVSDLEHFSPAVAPSDGRWHEWYEQFLVSGTGSYHYVAAVEGYDIESQSWAVQYMDGDVSSTCNGAFHVDQGKFNTGPNGSVEIDVPVANLGASMGRLQYIQGESITNYGYRSSATVHPYVGCEDDVVADTAPPDREFDLASGKAVDPSGSVGSAAAGNDPAQPKSTRSRPAAAATVPIPSLIVSEQSRMEAVLRSARHREL